MDAAPIAIINETLAHKHWGDTSPIGQQIEIDHVTREIIGVVANVQEYGAGEEPPAMDYIPAAQLPSRWIAVALRSGLPMENVLPPLRAVDSNIPVFDISTMEQRIRDWDGGNRVLAQLLAIFAGIALLLAILGVYGVAALSG